MFRLTRRVLYLLIDPRDGEIRYIGATRSEPKKRTREHIQHAIHRCSGNQRLAAWLLQLRSHHLAPIVETLFECFSDNDLSLMEQVWIRRLLLAKCRLFNVRGVVYKKLRGALNASRSNRNRGYEVK